MNVEQGRWRADASATDDIPAELRSRRRHMVLIAGAILIALTLAVFLMFRGRGPAKSPTSALPTVTVFVPGRAAVANVVTATGTLSAKRDMPIGIAGEGGMVRKVLVDAGSWVHAGQTLATVDPAVETAQASQMQAQIAAAQADAKLAQATLDRAEALLPRGFISKADIDSRTASRDAANAKVRLAQAQYREMEARLGRLDIRAPTAGLVLSRAVENGQIVSSGSTALFHIAADGVLELRAKLAEQDLAGIRVGMSVTVRPIGSQESFSGSVWQVSPIIDPVTRQGEARVQLAYAPALRPGGFASAIFSSAATHAPLLPESAVMSDAKGNFVYIIDGANRVVRRSVRIGDASDAGIAVLSGLDGTERVVYSAGAFLNPGEKVIPDTRPTVPAAG